MSWTPPTEPEPQRVVFKSKVRTSVKKMTERVMDLNPLYGLIFSMVLLSGILEVFMGGASIAWNILILVLIISLTIERVIKPKRRKRKTNKK